MSKIPEIKITSSENIKIEESLNNNESIYVGDYSILGCQRDYHKLQNEYNKILIKSDTYISIVERLKLESTNLLKISKSFDKKSIKTEDFNTSYFTSQYSLESSIERINEDINSLLSLNQEKDKNLKELYNQYASGFLKFSELSYQKGIDIILINTNKEIQNAKRLTKNEASEIIEKMDTPNKVNNPNETVYYISTNAKFVEIPCENKYISNNLDNLNIDPFSSSSTIL